MLRFFLALVFAALAQAAPAAQVAYYNVPPGSHPHDVAPAPDGKIWYTAQRQGALGILDPETGKTEHIPLGGDSAPHGVIAGPDRAAWITDSGLNAIVRVDPATEKFESFPSTRRQASVRQLLGRGNEVWGAESGVDRLVVVRD